VWGPCRAVAYLRGGGQRGAGAPGPPFGGRKNWESNNNNKKGKKRKKREKKYKRKETQITIPTHTGIIIN